jgi:hypothetical protein
MMTDKINLPDFSNPNNKSKVADELARWGRCAQDPAGTRRGCNSAAR